MSAVSRLSKGGYLSRPSTVPTAEGTLEHSAGFHLATGLSRKGSGSTATARPPGTSRGARQARRAWTCYVEDDFDTTLEDVHKTIAKAKLRPARKPKDTYLDTCKKLKVLPIKRVTEGLDKPRLDLSHRGLLPKECLAIAYALLNNLSLKELVLDNNQMGDEGAKYIISLLADNGHITKLGLGSNGLGRASARPLVAAVLDTNAITHLNLSDNQFDDSQAAMFSKLIMTSEMLIRLNLSHNSFSDEAALSFGLAISTNESLQELDLSWNKFRPQGSASILRGLAQNKELRYFLYAMNGVNVKGGKAVADVITSNTSLLELDLSSCRLHDDSGMVIAKAMRENNTLTSLKLGGNYFTTVAVTAVMEVLQKFPAAMTDLRLLDFGDTAVLRGALMLVEEVKDQRPRLQIKMGPTVRSQFDITQELGNDLTNKHPLVILKWFASERRLRLVELFRLIDRDGDGLLERHEFIKTIMLFEIPLTESQLDKLMDDLDANGDGVIDYGELLEGDKQLKRRVHMKKEEEARRFAALKALNSEKHKVDMTRKLTAEEKVLDSAGGKEPQMRTVVNEAVDRQS